MCMYVNPQIRKTVYGEDVRVPLDKIRFPPKCIVCTKDSMEKGGALLRYGGTTKQRNFSVTLPLCKDHSTLFQKGQRYVKFSMGLMGGSIIPFVIALILAFGILDYPISVPFFVAGLVCCIGGYFALTSASNHLSANGRGQAKIRDLSETDVVITFKNLEWVAQYKQFLKNPPKH